MSTNNVIENKKVEEALEELASKKGSLPERARKDLETHITEYHRLILKMARKYVRSRVEYPDLVQEAMIGLILADRDFDPSRSTDFHTYAIYRIKGKMYEYCIANDNPIYVPTHVAKAASYVKQMRRLLEEQLNSPDVSIDEVILIDHHPVEKTLNPSAYDKLREMKRKLARIALNSKMAYERLAGLAAKSLSSVVNDEVLSKVPKDTEKIEDIILGGEVREQFRELLGEKRLLVLEMRSQDWTYREIAEKLYTMGYRNKSGGVISRQAVKGIWDETLKTIHKSSVYRDLLDSGLKKVEK